MIYSVSKKMEIAACHHLTLSYDSKCRNIHDYLDHGNLNELLPFNPTAENIAE